MYEQPIKIHRKLTSTDKNNKMKKVSVVLGLVLICTVGAFAQQVPLYSHYYYNTFLYNPAMAGSNSYGQAYIINRNQWNNIPDAPRTKAFTIDGPLRAANVGIGAALYRDEAGIFNSTGGQVAYRYGISLNNDHKLNFGLAIGFLDTRLDFNKLRAKHGDDEVLISQFQNATGFDATFGLNYNYKKLNIGLAVPQVLANEIAYDNITNNSDVEYALERHFLTTVGYEFNINNKLKFEPLAMVRITPNAPLQYDINAMFSYDDKFWLGGMYRSEYSATVSAAVRVLRQFVVGYSYDAAVNTYRQYMKGAHEVMIGFQFGGSPADDPEIKKRFKGLDERVNKNKEDIEDLDKRVKENRDDIDENEEGIKDNEKKIDEELDKLRKDFEDFKKKIESGDIQVGDAFEFSNVYFETDRYDIKGVAVTELNNLADILKKNPNMKISIQGHADKRGSAQYNERLARNRALSVKNYLIGLGVDPSQLAVSSYGESEPAEPGDLSANRRVEFTVIKR